MENFLKFVVIDNESFKVTVLSIIWILLAVSAASTVSWLLRSHVRRKKLKDVPLSLILKRLFLVINLLIWLGAFVVILAVLNLPLKDALEYPLIDTENFNLKPVYFFLAVVVIVFTKILLSGLEKIFRFETLASKEEVARRRSVLRFFSYIIWVIAVLIILNLTGPKLTVLWGAGAALLVGIGFGLQQIFADLISGIFLLFEGNLKEDDVVELDNGTIGRVTHIGARTSKIKTRENVVMIIPNTKFITNEVINWSHIEVQTRFRVDVGVAYGSDVRLVEQVLLHCTDAHPDISQSPKPFVRFQDFGDSSLDFSLYFWSARAFEVENIKSDIRFLIDASFRENNIQIPFPQRDVHIKGRGTGEVGRGTGDVGRGMGDENSAG